MSGGNSENRVNVLKWWEQHQHLLTVDGVVPELSGSYSFGANHALSDAQCTYVVPSDVELNELGPKVALKMEEVFGTKRTIGKTKAGLCWISGAPVTANGVELWKFDATVRAKDQHAKVQEGIDAWLAQTPEEKAAYIEKSEELTRAWMHARDTYGRNSEEFKAAIAEKAKHMHLLKTLPQ